TMKLQITMGMLALGFGACGALDPASEGSPTEARQAALGFATTGLGSGSGTATTGTGTGTTAGETASTVTFFAEAGLSGDSLPLQVMPADLNEAVDPITFDSIQGANLAGRISSVRLICGSRYSALTLLEGANTGPVWNWFGSGQGYTLECNPNETQT